MSQKIITFCLFLVWEYSTFKEYLKWLNEIFLKIRSIDFYILLLVCWWSQYLCCLCCCCCVMQRCYKNVTSDFGMPADSLKRGNVRHSLLKCQVEGPFCKLKSRQESYIKFSHWNGQTTVCIGWQISSKIFKICWQTSLAENSHFIFKKKTPTNFYLNPTESWHLKLLMPQSGGGCVCETLFLWWIYLCCYAMGNKLNMMIMAD